MKNIARVVIALVSGLGSAHATSLHPDTFRDVRLSYNFGPMYQLHHLPVGVRTLSSIVVRKNGHVVFVRRGNAITPKPGKIIAKLSAHQMDRIERLIDIAAAGQIKSPEALCAAVPTETRNYRADGNKVILSVGAEPCGLTHYNDTKAAERLKRLLDNFRAKVESQVHHLAN